MIGKTIGWLNGKKSLIGGLLTISAELLTYVAPLAAGTRAARVVGVGLLTVGLIHKLWKQASDVTELEPLDGKEDK